VEYKQAEEKKNMKKGKTEEKTYLCWGWPQGWVAMLAATLQRA
jgi:hypothetical protein